MKSSFRRGRLVLAILLGVPAGLMFLFSVARPVMGSSENFIDPVLSASCHRMPSRCIDLPWGISGLCARCTIFWLGLATGILIMYRPMFRILFWVGFLLLLPLITDGLLQYHSLYESSNFVRSVTGLAAGFGISVIIMGRMRDVRSG
ncbi:MAG: DUF2085 domain-containing protein [Candidatus Aegiribacteria sp.]|nr:DUF2085 domain-containing protein [Candidatus Aegiribacteria sp.]